MLIRALIKTHHISSRKKIAVITKAAKRYDCAVYLKTGQHPPGIMIAECEMVENMKNWVAHVKVGISLLDCSSLSNRTWPQCHGLCSPFLSYLQGDAPGEKANICFIFLLLRNSLGFLNLLLLFSYSVVVVVECLLTSSSWEIAIEI